MTAWHWAFIQDCKSVSPDALKWPEQNAGQVLEHSQKACLHFVRRRHICNPKKCASSAEHSCRMHCMVTLQAFKKAVRTLWREEMGTLKNVALVCQAAHMFRRDTAMYNCTLYTHKCACTVCYTTSVQHRVEKQLAALFPWEEGKKKKKRTRKNHPYNRCSHFYAEE